MSEVHVMPAAMEWIIKILTERGETVEKFDLEVRTSGKEELKAAIKEAESYGLRVV